MVIWNAETVSPFRISRRIPMLLAAAMGNLPLTVEVGRNLNFVLDNLVETERVLSGRWMLLAWRGLPTQPGVVASASVEVDGINIISTASFKENTYLVGPTFNRNQPASEPAISRFVVAEDYITLKGRTTSGSTKLETEYLAVKLEYE